MTQNQNNPASPDQQNNQPKTIPGQAPGSAPGEAPAKQDDKSPAAPVVNPIKT